MKSLVGSEIYKHNARNSAIGEWMHSWRFGDGEGWLQVYTYWALYIAQLHYRMLISIEKMLSHKLSWEPKKKKRKREGA